MPELANLIPIDESLVVPASFACQRAFRDDPTTAYLIPNPVKRDKQHYIFEFGLRLSLQGLGEAYTTSRACEGVAYWTPAEEKQPIGSFLMGGWPPLPLRCGLRHLIRDIRVNSFLSRLKQEYAPPHHVYLALLAVDPPHQGMGFASTLLRPMLKRLDEQGVPCYLETQTGKNVSFYQHFGFRLVHETSLPGTSLPIYAMLHEA